MLIDKSLKQNFWHFIWRTLLLFVSLSILFACQMDQPRFPLIHPLPSTPRPAATVAPFAPTTLPSSDRPIIPSTEQLLLQTHVPASDLRDLALRLRPDITEVPLVVNNTTPDYTVGDRINFWVLNASTQETNQITAELIHKTAVAYAWVEVGPSYNPAALIETVDQFSTQSYPAAVAFFGPEWKPGVDNDPRLHLLYTTGMGAVAGYFGYADQYSRLINPYSNEKEILYIDLAKLYNDALLAHEFQHMIHRHQDSNEATWVDEGLSEYAQEVAGLGTTSVFLSEFLNQPDTPLTAWEDGTPNHYGASYLFIKYLHQRFGPTLLRALVAQPANGVAGLQQALTQQGIPQEFDVLFADWVVANYANQPTALEPKGVYGYQNFPFRQPSTTHWSAPYPATPYQATVHNYATDYIRLQGEGRVTVQFAGQTTTQLAALPAFSGRYAWWSNQGDRVDSRLTRAFDLRSIGPEEPLTLEMAMWWEIEEHYDYGYVLASRDGRKWDILPGQQTTRDNPTGHSFGPAYTGESPLSKATMHWVIENFDLSPYAGEQIWLRFEYVTDDAVHHTGWFIDDVRIPAIHYTADFAHGPDGWESEGWLLTDNHLTQRWLLQVLEFAGDTLINLHRVNVDGAGRAQVELIELSANREAVLAISAVAPATTAPGHYELEIRRTEDK